MNLSKRAVAYLKTMERDNQFIVSEEETREYLKIQEIVSIEEFIKFQVDYSGYQLTIQNDPWNSFSCQLFSKKQIKKNENLELIKTGDSAIGTMWNTCYSSI